MIKVDYKSKWYQEYKPDYKNQFNDNLLNYWAMIYSDRWQILSDIAGKQFFDSRSVLEIGCGMGRALKWFKEFGGIEIGVEPSDYASSIATEKGLFVINDYFENTNLDTKFDVIYIEQVLSHIPDYKGTLQKAADLLKDDGLLMIEEPNDNNPLQKLLEEKHGKYWVVADHCHYLNFDGLSSDCKEVGLEEVDRMATFPMELFQIMGTEYIGNPEMGKMAHRQRFEFENKLPSWLRIKVYKKWAELGIGRDLVMIFTKGGKNNDGK